ncbi:PepSY-associated TM helix domain-containing protein [Falsirhodobacter halotolerans]|uniref:PepSY-associated TM helix domain-containing protein n=1 Tax=Falsirhodobacter halotolerans TaxID=1146892 RepID=UPI001FD51204|nr:PepSY-associated TM helix domain-containing protein [Falsirhodobacter halotolerans]MCJ8140017.1 PepSY domain-containing protein [Falsirhodobacter halotolerans]
MSHIPDQPRGATALRPFLLRLHFYIGLFVGPFIFIAALTGLLYVLTPQIEDRLYADALYTDSAGAARSLTDQALAARAVVPDLDVSAVRPATGEGRTTRIMFSDPALGPSENRTIFVDPVTLAIRGDMTTYGTSGILPFRITLDYLHRNLLLGDWGRYYSELAASWLWVAVLGGVALWATGPKRRRAVADMPPPQRRRWIHATLGVVLSVVLVFISITGLTWSQAGGQRITDLRNAIGWVTPSASTALDGATMPMDAHAHHHMDLSAREDRLDQLDAVEAASRKAGIDSPFLEIRLPKPGQAWSVREYDRSWPTQVDTIALDPATMAVTSRADFAEFTLVPKLIRWGIDAHMGILFGVANQIVMGLVAVGLMISIAYGYAMWWTRRPAAGGLPLTAAWMRLSVPARMFWAVGAVALGWALPVLGISLAAFLLIDILRWVIARRSV